MVPILKQVGSIDGVSSFQFLLFSVRNNFSKWHDLLLSDIPNTMTNHRISQFVRSIQLSFHYLSFQMLLQSQGTAFKISDLHEVYYKISCLLGSIVVLFHKTNHQISQFVHRIQLSFHDLSFRMLLQRQGKAFKFSDLHEVYFKISCLLVRLLLVSIYICM